MKMCSTLKVHPGLNCQAEKNILSFQVPFFKTHLLALSKQLIMPELANQISK